LYGKKIQRRRANTLIVEALLVCQAWKDGREYHSVRRSVSAPATPRTSYFAAYTLRDTEYAIANDGAGRLWTGLYGAIVQPQAKGQLWTMPYVVDLATDQMLRGALTVPLGCRADYSLIVLDIPPRALSIVCCLRMRHMTP
jgi:hypothetical protein